MKENYHELDIVAVFLYFSLQEGVKKTLKLSPSIFFFFLLPEWLFYFHFGSSGYGRHPFSFPLKKVSNFSPLLVLEQDIDVVNLKSPEGLHAFSFFCRLFWGCCRKKDREGGRNEGFWISLQRSQFRFSVGKSDEMVPKLKTLLSLLFLSFLLFFWRNWESCSLDFIFMAVWNGMDFISEFCSYWELADISLMW